MKKIGSPVQWTALVLLVLTAGWIVLTILSMSQVGSNWGTEEYVRWVSDPDIFFNLNYINAVFITIGAVILYAQLYQAIKKLSPQWAMAGFAFVPIYGVFNIICYVSQITLLPALINSGMNDYLIYQWIQASQQTFAGFINGMAYVLLGIPSVLFGFYFIRDQKRGTGFFLIMNGLFCGAGLAGYLARIQILSMGMMIGGAFFLVSLFFMIIEFKPQSAD